jgi:hypothetical protein
MPILWIRAVVTYVLVGHTSSSNDVENVGDDGDKSTDSPDTNTDNTVTCETSSNPNDDDDQ